MSIATHTIKVNCNLFIILLIINGISYLFSVEALNSSICHPCSYYEQFILEHSNSIVCLNNEIVKRCNIINPDMCDHGSFYGTLKFIYLFSAFIYFIYVIFSYRRMLRRMDSMNQSSSLLLSTIQQDMQIKVLDPSMLRTESLEYNLFDDDNDSSSNLSDLIELEHFPIVPTIQQFVEVLGDIDSDSFQTSSSFLRLESLEVGSQYSDMTEFYANDPNVWEYFRTAPIYDYIENESIDHQNLSYRDNNQIVELFSNLPFSEESLDTFDLLHYDSTKSSDSIFDTYTIDFTKNYAMSSIYSSVRRDPLFLRLESCEVSSEDLVTYVIHDGSEEYVYSYSQPDILHYTFEDRACSLFEYGPRDLIFDDIIIFGLNVMDWDQIKEIPINKYVVMNEYGKFSIVEFNVYVSFGELYTFEQMKFAQDYVMRHSRVLELYLGYYNRYLNLAEEYSLVLNILDFDMPFTKSIINSQIAPEKIETMNFMFRNIVSASNAVRNKRSKFYYSQAKWVLLLCGVINLPFVQAVMANPPKQHDSNWLWMLLIFLFCKIDSKIFTLFISEVISVIQIIRKRFDTSKVKKKREEGDLETAGLQSFFRTESLDVIASSRLRVESFDSDITISNILGLQSVDSSLSGISNVLWVAVSLYTGPRLSDGSARFIMHTMSVLRNLVTNIQNNTRVLRVLSQLDIVWDPFFEDMPVFRTEASEYDDIELNFFSELENYFKKGVIGHGTPTNVIVSFWQKIVLINGISTASVEFINSKDKNYLNFMTQINRSLIEGGCTIENVIEVALRAAKFFSIIVLTGSIRTAFKSIHNEPDKVFFKIQTQMNEVINDEPNKVIDYHEIRIELLKLYDIMCKQAVTFTGSDRILSSARSRIVLDWINIISSRIIQRRKTITPYVLTFYGSAGVGKSSNVDFFETFLHKRVGMEKIIKRGVCNEYDKYDSNIYNNTTCIFVDDLGNLKDEYRETSAAATLLKFVQPNASSLNKADLASKGTTFNLASFVIVTTNVHDCDATKESNHPFSIARRLGDCVEVEVLDQYKGVNGELDLNKLTTEQLQSSFPVYNKYHLYTVNFCATGNEIKYIKKGLTLDQLLDHIGSKVDVHFNRERNRISLDTFDDICDFCPHRKPYKVCSECMSLRVESLTSILEENISKNIPRSVIFTYALFITFDRLRSKYVFFIENHALLSSLLFLSIFILVVCFPFVLPYFAFVFMFIFCILIVCRHMIKEMVKFKEEELIAKTIPRFSKNAAAVVLALAKLAIGGTIMKFAIKAVSSKVRLLLRPESLDENLESKKTVIFKENTPITVDEVILQGMMGTPNWAKPRHVSPVLDEIAIGASENLLPLIGRNLFWATFRYDTSISKIQCLALNSNLIVFPAHVWYKNDILVDEMQVTLARKPNQHSSIMSNTKRIERGTATYIDFKKDICICSVRFFGDLKDITQYFIEEPFRGVGECMHIRMNDVNQFQIENVEAHDVSICQPQKDYIIEYIGKGYKPREKNALGWCGSVLVRVNNGVHIVGIHSLGSRDNEESLGICTIVSKVEISKAINCFRRDNTYTQPTDINLLTEYVGRDPIELSDRAHKKSVVNFQYNVVPLLGANLKEGFTPTSTVTPHPYFMEAKQFLGVGEFFEKPRNYKFNINAWSVVHISSANTIEGSPSIFSRAVEDFLTGIDKLVSCPKNVRYVKGDFLSLDEVLNGIEGNPFHTSINSTTSAGYPYNTQKQFLMDGEPGNWRLKSDFHSQFNLLYNKVMSGKHSGTVFASNLKDEPVEIGKEKVRLFFAGAFHSYILIKMFLGDAIAFINSNPAFFETSIGLNVVSDKWHERVTDSYTQGEKCINLDFSKYDQTQNHALNTAAVCFILKVLKHLGYTECMLRKCELVANEFLTPIINMKGSFILLNNLHPSGYLLTAHLGGIKGSLAFRHSFIKSHGIAPGRTFKDYVLLNNLGDDNDATVTDLVDISLFNPRILSNDLKMLGLSATNAVDKNKSLNDYIPHSERVFLKRKTRYSHDLGRLVGLLAPKSIFRPFQMITSGSAKTNDQTMDICRNAATEIFYYGREHYNTVQERLVCFCEATNVPIPLEITLSYDMRMEKDRETNKRFDFHSSYPDDIVFEHEFPILNLRPESEEINGLTVFAAEDGETAAATPAVSYNSMLVSGSNTGIANFLEREIEGPTYEFKLGSSSMVELRPYTLFFKNLGVRDKIRNYSYFCGELDVKFVLSASSQHSGGFLIANTPNSDVDILFGSPGPGPGSCILSQREHCTLYVGWHNEASITVPFVYENPMSSFEEVILDRLSLIKILPIAKLTHTANNSSVYITVFIRMKNLKLSGITSLRLEAGEHISDRISSAAHGMENVSSLLSSLPEIAIPLEIASKVVSAGGHLAGIMGHSRPRTPSAQPIILHQGPGMASSNLGIPARKLALDNNQQVSALSAVADSPNYDDLAFEPLLTKYNLINILQWTGSNPKNHQILIHGVSPANAIIENDIVTLPSQAFVSNHFRYWRGSISYKFQVVTQNTNGGRLILYYEPRMDAPSVNLSTNYNKSIVIDIKKTKEFVLTVHWQSQPAFLLTSADEFVTHKTLNREFHNGYFSLNVLTGLTGIGTVTPEATVLVWQKAHDDIVFCQDDRSVFDSYELYMTEPTKGNGINFGGRDGGNGIGGGRNAGPQCLPPEGTQERVDFCQDLVCGNEFIFKFIRCKRRSDECIRGDDNWEQACRDRYFESQLEANKVVSTTSSKNWLERVPPVQLYNVITTNKPQSYIDKTMDGTITMFGTPLEELKDNCIKIIRPDLTLLPDKCIPINSTVPVVSPIQSPKAIPKNDTKAPSILDFFSQKPVAKTSTQKPSEKPILMTTTAPEKVVAPTAPAFVPVKDLTQKPVTKQPVRAICKISPRNLPPYFIGKARMMGANYGLSHNTIPGNTIDISLPVYGSDTSIIRTVRVNLFYGDIYEVVSVNSGTVTFLKDSFIQWTGVVTGYLEFIVLKIKSRTWITLGSLDTFVPESSTLHNVTLTGNKIEVIDFSGAKNTGSQITSANPISISSDLIDYLCGYSVFSIVTEGNTIIDAKHHTYPDPFAVVFAKQVGGVEISMHPSSTPSVPSVLFKVAYLSNMKLRLESLEIEETPTLIVGSPDGGNDMAVKIFAGERYISFLSLAKRFRLVEEAEKPAGAIYDVEEPYYVAENLNTQFLHVLCLSFLAVRGSIVVVYHYESGESASMLAYKPSLATKNNYNIFESGIEYTDTRLNPSLTVEYPYHSRRKYEVPRTFGVGNPDILYRGVRIRSHTPKNAKETGVLQTYVSVGEDFSCSIFLGCPSFVKKKT